MTNGKWGNWFSVSSQDSLPSSPTMGRWMGDDGLISEEMDLSKVAHRSEYRLVVAAQYRIGESDMHPDLEWLARNVSEWNPAYEFFAKTPEDAMIRKSDDGWNFCGPNSYSANNRTCFSFNDWLQARQQQNLPTPGISDEGEEECLNLAHERMADNREKYSPYFKDVSKLERIDVYRVVSLFDCEKHGHAISHAVKKLLLTGVRTGGKDVETEVREAIDSLNRWLEMRKEDEA